MTTRVPQHQSERGAGTVAGLAIIGLVAGAMLSLAPVIAVLGSAGKARAAADAAALAAADAAIGITPGVPCVEAQRVSAANAATLTACLIDGVIATVEVRVGPGAVSATAAATAGPPRD